MPKHPNMDWDKEQQASCRFNYGTKPSGGFIPNVAVNSAAPTIHQNGAVYAPRPAGAKKSQSVESYNHGGVVPVNEEAKAVEKATYLVYAAQDRLLQACTSSSTASLTTACSTSLQSSGPHPPSIQHNLPVLSATESQVVMVQEINATLALAAADYYQGQTQEEPVPPQGRHYPPSRPVTSVVIPMAAGKMTIKVPNILLSVIPQGILAPRGSGGISPRGTFSPIEVNQVKPFSTQAQSPTIRASKGGAFNTILSNNQIQMSMSTNMSTNASSESNSTNTNTNTTAGFIDINRFPLFQRENVQQYRNLPSSNLANINSPL